jgi:phage/plasmid-associated DNA primase
MANDSTYNWIKVNCLEKESFMNHGVNDLYDMYSEYCNSNGMQPAWKEQFVDSVIGYFHGVLNTGLINGDRNFLKVNI